MGGCIGGSLGEVLKAAWVGFLGTVGAGPDRLLADAPLSRH